MYDDVYITEKEARDSINEPLKLVKQDKNSDSRCRLLCRASAVGLIGMFGEEYFYTACLTIISCVDSKLQESAANALRFGIKTYDMKRGYRGPLRNIPVTNWQKDLEALPRPVGKQSPVKLCIMSNNYINVL
jgi:penicillin-binding protein 1A